MTTMISRWWIAFVHPEMMIWGVKGGPPPFFWAKSNFLLLRKACTNCRQSPSKRKVSGRKKKERRKKNNGKFSGHYIRQRTHNVRAHALRSNQFLKISFKLERLCLESCSLMDLSFTGNFKKTTLYEHVLLYVNCGLLYLHTILLAS